VLIEGESGRGKDASHPACTNGLRRSHKPYLALTARQFRRRWSNRPVPATPRAPLPRRTSAARRLLRGSRKRAPFLDEIGELPLELQAKLCRVLENGEDQRRRRNPPRFSNARVVTATNRDPARQIKGGRFPVRTSTTGCRYSRSRCHRCGEMGEDKLTLLNHSAISTPARARTSRSRSTLAPSRCGEDYHFPATLPRTCATSPSD